MASDNPAAPYRDPESFELEAAGHCFTFYPAGRDRLSALLELIESAATSIEIFYYLFEEDGDGRRVRDALAAAAARNVRVALMVDGFGTAAPDRFFAPIRENGGSFSRFSARWNVRYLIRNHQKFVIVDGQKVMAGGSNVSHHYFASPEENGWCDLSFVVTGQVVESFVRWFSQLERWSRVDGSKLRAIRLLLRRWDPGSGPVQLLLGGPTRIPSTWARRIKRDLATARRLDLVMAYFSPPRSFRRLISRIPRQGGEASLIMAGKSDNGATIGASRMLYARFLRAGVTLYEFQPCKLHMKMVVVDDIVYFGSANFDMRSIRLNLELMVRVEDAALAQKMRGLVSHMENSSEAITMEVYRRKRGPLNWIKWRLSFLLVGILDYTVSRRLNLGL
ncbi:MAG: cardiolipin synthase B [Sphingomonadaceae bacterium]|nr:cardiolipin synthase B [Sphingomonadaceae bacterium]